MYELNRRAMQTPREKLLDELKEANERKMYVLKEHEKKYGMDRPKIGSYMENIALPGLYGFKMRDYYHNAELAMDIDLRNKLFWLDNSHDDGLAAFEVNAGSMYYDMTLFGLNINYTTDGVPNFEKHALSENPDISQLKPYSFHETGEMPMVHKRYHDLKKISEDLYNGEINVSFPRFGRGPLDIYVQLRGYEGFINDCSENPEYVNRLLNLIVDWRIQYNRLREQFLVIEPSQTTTIDDDWINVPFISPAIFDEFVAPVYKKIQDNEGPIVRFHTCGKYAALMDSLQNTMPSLDNIDVSGWNDILEIDRLANPDIMLNISFINTFVITGSAEEHRKMLEHAKTVSKNRRTNVNAQAIVKVLGTIDDSIIAMNRFIDLARVVLSN